MEKCCFRQRLECVQRLEEDLSAEVGILARPPRSLQERKRKAECCTGADQCKSRQRVIRIIVSSHGCFAAATETSQTQCISHHPTGTLSPALQMSTGHDSFRHYLKTHCFKHALQPTFCLSVHLQSIYLLTYFLLHGIIFHIQRFSILATNMLNKITVIIVMSSNIVIIPFLFAEIGFKVHLLAMQVVSSVSSWRVLVSCDGNKMSLDDGNLPRQLSDRQCRRCQLRLTDVLLFHQRMKTCQQLRLVCSRHANTHIYTHANSGTHSCRQW